MDNTAEDIMGVYAQKTRGIYVPNPEQEFQEKCRKEGQGLLEKYFSRGKQPVVTEQTTTHQRQTEQPVHPQILNERQQRNSLLNEAALNIGKVLPLFVEKKDREYLKEIREAIEEMMD